MSEWEYGVVHVEGGEIVDIERVLTLDEAVETTGKCGPDDTGASCYAVRRPRVVEWQPVPSA